MGLEFDTWMRRMACETGMIDPVDPVEAGGVCEVCEISGVDRRGRYQGQRRVAPRQV